MALQCAARAGARGRGTLGLKYLVVPQCGQTSAGQASRTICHATVHCLACHTYDRILRALPPVVPPVIGVMPISMLFVRSVGHPLARASGRLACGSCFHHLQ